MRTPLPHLLGYLADGRYLSVEELDRIQDHIRDRKSRLTTSKGLPPEPSHGRSFCFLFLLSVALPFMPFANLPVRQLTDAEISLIRCLFVVKDQLATEIR